MKRELTRYGDIAPAKIKGLLLDGVEFITRLTKWRVFNYGLPSAGLGSR